MTETERASVVIAVLCRYVTGEDAAGALGLTVDELGKELLRLGDVGAEVVSQWRKRARGQVGDRRPVTA